MWHWVHRVDGIIPTSRDAKKKVCDLLGIKIDVWIDDNPNAVHNSAKQIWGESSSEGNVVIEQHARGGKRIERLPTTFPEDCLEIFSDPREYDAYLFFMYLTNAIYIFFNLK